MGRESSPTRSRGGSRKGSRQDKGSTFDGFNFRVGDSAYVYTPKEGEVRNLRFTVQPDVKAAIAKRPELFDMLAFREKALWVERMEAKGYQLVSKLSAPRRRPSMDPTDPPGSDWYVITGRWFHHGPVAILPRSGVEAKWDEEKALGAGKTRNNAADVARHVDHAMDADGNLPPGLLFGGDVSEREAD